jgi:hypothetical protein
VRAEKRLFRAAETGFLQSVWLLLLVNNASLKARQPKSPRAVPGDAALSVYLGFWRRALGFWMDVYMVLYGL